MEYDQTVSNLTSNMTNSSLSCPTVSPSDLHLLLLLSLLLEGVLQILLSILGILGNAASIFLLTRMEMRSSFNQVTKCKI